MSHSSQPICLHPENPHYFLFRGQPTVLITSAEHYGAVLNLDFDYQPYLKVLAAHALNYTRIYAGAYLEPDNYFIQDNPLGPRIGRHCLPWGRSDQPGYPFGGNLFDLDTWNQAYFERLKPFVSTAGELGIVVEVCFFNAMYPDTWDKMPLFHANNIQGVSSCACKDFQTLKDARLVAYQAAYVRKLTQELNAFDNVILEICDEPGLHGTPPEEYTPWLRHLAAVVHAAEEALPAKHILAQQVCGQIGGLGDVSGDPAIQLIVGQYVGETDGKQFGGMQLLDTEYGHNKPIELNETAYYPIWYKGDILADARVEAWEFMVGGGAGFNQLNGLFSIPNPSAAGTEIDALLDQLGILKQFFYSFDFLPMHRDTGLIAGALPAGAFCRGISQPGKQYALYLHHSKNANIAYIAQPGEQIDQLELNLSAGSYRSEWIDPASGSRLRCEDFVHPGGLRPMTTPRFSIDIALRIVSVTQLEDHP